MGLDNIPQPRPCQNLKFVKKYNIPVVRRSELKKLSKKEIAKKLGLDMRRKRVKEFLKNLKKDKNVVNCEKCVFREKHHIIGILGNYCWLRGKVYDDITQEVGITLYQDLDRDDLLLLLKELKENYKQLLKNKALKEAYGKELKKRLDELIVYLTLIIESGVKKLIAWY